MKRILFVLAFSMLSFGSACYAATTEKASDVTPSATVSDPQRAMPILEIVVDEASSKSDFLQCCKSGAIIIGGVPDWVFLACAPTCEEAQKKLKAAMIEFIQQAI
jgi:hypothetical protein